MQPVVVKANQVIMAPDQSEELGRPIFIIEDCRVRASMPDGSVFEDMECGDFFGEVMSQGMLAYEACVLECFERLCSCCRAHVCCPVCRVSSASAEASVRAERSLANMCVSVSRLAPTRYFALAARAKQSLSVLSLCSRGMSPPGIARRSTSLSGTATTSQLSLPPRPSPSLAWCRWICQILRVG